MALAAPGVLPKKPAAPSRRGPFTILSAACALALPLVLSFVIDNIIGTKPAALPAFLMTIFNRVGGRDFLLTRL